MKVLTFYTLLSFLLVMWSGESSHQKKTISEQKNKKEQKQSASSQAAPVWGFESAALTSPTVAATKTVSVTNDVAPLGLPSPGDQLTYVVEITNTGNMDATGVNFVDILDANLTLVPGSLRCSPVPMPDAYDVFGNVKISVPVGSGVLANDQNPCGTGGPLQVTTTNTTGTQGEVMMNPDGSFTFNPASGFNGTTTFTYNATNGVFAKQGTVTLNVSGRIWFIDNSQGTNGDGRLGTPYNSLANFNTGASGGSAGDIIFLYRQTATNYSGAGLTLKNNQYLIGQGASSSIAAITGITLPAHSMSLPATGGTNPVIAHSATAVTLASGNQLHGFNVSNTGGTGINGTSVGNLKIRDLSAANSGGTALNLASGALDVIIKKLDASNATTGFALSSTTGSFTVEGTGTTDGSGGTIQTISQRGADIQTATNITLKNMTFTNANTADSGGVGTCDVTTTLACHGALYLRNITTIELNNIDVNGVEEQGLNGNNISAMNMTGCSFTNCGDEQYEGCVKIRELSGTCFITNSTFSFAENELVEIFNTTATTLLSLSVTGSTFSDSFDKTNGAKGFYFSGTSNQTRNILVDNCLFYRLKSQGVYINASAGTLNADVTDCTFSKDTKKYMDGVHIFPQGTSTANINILRNTLTTAGGGGILVQGSGTSSTFQARINQNQVTGPHGCGDCLSGGGETVNCNCFGDAITVWATENTSGKANVNNNTITGIDDSGRGVYALARNQADLSILISGNSVTFDTDSWYAYDLFCGNTDAGATSTLCAHLTNNTLGSGVTSAFTHVRARATTNVAGSTSAINLQSIPASATLANVWDNNGNTPLTTAPMDPVTVSSSTSGAGTETITFNHPGCDYTLTHPTAIAMPEEEYVQLSNTSTSSGLAANTPQGGLNNAQMIGQIPGDNDTPTTPQSVMMMDMVTVSGFTLPATTGSIYIDFKATINNPFPQGVCSVSNQGTVSGSNFSNVLTDNPFVTGAANPTVTTISIAPEITSCPSTINKNSDSGLCTASTTFSAAANTGCPTPTITYKIGATPITSPYNFPVGTTTVTVTASNGVMPDATCTFDVVVTDVQAPDITCLSGTQMRGTNLGNCTYTVSGTEFNPTVSENCPGYTLVNDFNNTATLAGAALPTGTTTVVWTITDGAGATDMCSVVIQVTDDDNPSITCPAAASTPCNIADLPPYANLTDFTTAGGTVSDNCSINNASFTMLSQTGGPLSYTRTYQIADMAGNTATCMQTVTVSDNVNPSVTPGTIASCYPTVAAAEAAAIAATTATDNCGGTPTKTASTSGTCTAVVTVTATDAAGNMASTTYNTRIDNTAPVVTQGTIAACYTSVAAAEAAALAATSATDNCPGTLTETASTVGTCSAVITVTTADACGNSAQVTYNTSIDNASPTVTPGTIAACYPTAAAAEAAAIAATTANDDCPSNVVKTAGTTGTCSAVVTVTATDACGNSAQTTYNTRIDNTAPNVTQGVIAACYPTVAAAEAAALAATSATDNCPGALTETASTVGTCSAVVTVTTTDGCGNSAQVTYNTRIDNTAPIVTAGTIAACYPTVAVAEAAALAATTATDNCPGALPEVAITTNEPGCAAVIVVTVTDVCGNSADVTYNTRIDNTAPIVTAGTIAACYPTVAAAEAAAIAATTASDGCPGTVNKTASTTGTCSAVVTVTGTDQCGNSAQVTYNTRIDNTAPLVTQGTIDACYTSVAAAEAAALAATTATDNCPGALTETASTVGTCSAVITVTTTDACGNSAQVTYNTRVDNVGPTVIAGTIAACYPTAAAAEAAAIAATTANDDCPSSVMKTASTTGTCSAVITVTATDGCGNSASTTYNTRIDNTAPTVTQGTIAACYPTVAAAEAAALAATSATDNCPGALTETASTVGTCSAVVTVTTTDGCGNSAQVTYNTRIDNTAPVVTQGTINSCYPTLAAAEAAALAATTATDNCPGALVEVASTVGTCSAVIVVTTTDGCGNSAGVTYNTRIDNTAPNVTQGTIAACYPTVAAAEAAALAATSATDNCPGTLTETASTVGTCSAVVTVTTTDGCGNSASVTYNTRIDNTAPTVTTGTIAACYPTVAAAEAAALAATSATDNCPGTLTETASTVGTCTAVVTVTTTDGCGNSATVTYNTRIDNVGPTVTPGTIAACYSTVAAAEAAALAATTVVDDCLSTTTVTASTTGTCNAVVTITAVDGCGNSASTSYNTRIDNTPPVVSCKNSTVTLNGNGVYVLTSGDVLNLGATSDNCGQYTVTMNPNSFSCANKNQTFPVTVTVSDLCGNTSTCTSQITVVEGTALPSGWSAGDVGTNAMGSSIYSPCINNGSFVLNAKGYSTNTTDVQHTVYQTLCGDAEIKAHVAGLSPMGGWAGIQMRESSSQGSKKFTLKTQLSTILRREIRTSNFGVTNTLQSIVPPTHTWLRITRSGNTFTAYSSPDGINWTFRSAATFAMNSCIQVGLFVESYNNTTTTTATIDNVMITGGTPPIPLVDSGDISDIPQQQAKVKVYPNPTNGALMLDFSELIGKQVKVQVFNAQGQLVEWMKLDEARELEQLDLSPYSEGVYWIRVQAEGMTPVTEKIFKTESVIRP